MMKPRASAHLTTLGVLTLCVLGCESRTAPEVPSVAPAVAAATKAPSANPTEAVALRAQAALLPFKKELQETLTKALADGPSAAVSVCADLAPKLAERASSEQVTVGRSALRLRNPDNAPRAWLSPLMEELSRLPSAEGQHRVVPLEGGRHGYAEAIVLTPPCVLCHGKSLEPELAAQIAARYPSDQATGFEVGELRGVFWAELSL